MPEDVMGIQVKAFTMLFVVLFAVDAFVFHGEYRIRAVHGIASTFGTVHGLGPGRDWSKQKPSSNH
jgi:hypothetical protein